MPKYSQKTAALKYFFSDFHQFWKAQANNVVDNSYVSFGGLEDKSFSVHSCTVPHCPPTVTVVSTKMKSTLYCILLCSLHFNRTIFTPCIYNTCTGLTKKTSKKGIHYNMSLKSGSVVPVSRPCYFIMRCVAAGSTERSLETFCLVKDTLPAE